MLFIGGMIHTIFFVSVSFLQEKEWNNLEEFEMSLVDRKNWVKNRFWKLQFYDWGITIRILEDTEKFERWLL